MMRSKPDEGVQRSSDPPRKPPAAVTSPSTRSDTPPTGTSPLCHAHAPASPPGYSATVLEMFAWTVGTPAAIKAGIVTNDPPPASAFIAPAAKPAREGTAYVARECFTP